MNQNEFLKELLAEAFEAGQDRSEEKFREILVKTQSLHTDLDLIERWMKYAGYEMAKGNGEMSGAGWRRLTYAIQCMKEGQSPEISE